MAKKNECVDMECRQMVLVLVVLFGLAFVWMLFQVGSDIGALKAWQASEKFVRVN